MSSEQERMKEFIASTVEVEDDTEVLQQKIRALAELIQSSRHAVAFTGKSNTSNTHYLFTKLIKALAFLPVRGYLIIVLLKGFGRYMFFLHNNSRAYPILLVQGERFKEKVSRGIGIEGCTYGYSHGIT